MSEKDVQDFKEAVARGEKLHAAIPKRGREMIVPGPQPPPPEDLAGVYHKKGAFVALQFAGPGDSVHPWRTKRGCAVRLLFTGDTSKTVTDLCDEHAVGAARWYPTHEIFPVRMFGPCEDDARTERIMLAYAAYREHMKAEFQERMEKEQKGEAELPPAVASDESEETKSSPTVKVVGGEDTTHHQEVAHFPFFLICFIPEVCDTDTLDFSEPLMAVFAAGETEKEMEDYALKITEEFYPRINMLVVEGGKWLYPHLLADDRLGKIRTIYPNAERLQAVVSHAERAVTK